VMDTSPRPWFKKKRYLIPIALAVGLTLGGLGESGQSTSSVVNQQNKLQQAAVGTSLQPSNTNSVRSATLPSKIAPQAANLSNDNYYTSVDGNRVHSPAYSDSVPPGASALCRDGTYSFSQNRRGTCSRHGGVSQWL
jgi:Protein of unknown function (DUF3761)